MTAAKLVTLSPPLPPSDAPFSFNFSFTYIPPLLRWRSHPYTNTSSSGHSPDDEVRKGDEGGCAPHPHPGYAYTNKVEGGLNNYFYAQAVSCLAKPAPILRKFLIKNIYIYICIFFIKNLIL